MKNRIAYLSATQRAQPHDLEPPAGTTAWSGSPAAAAASAAANAKIGQFKYRVARDSATPTSSPHESAASTPTPAAASSSRVAAAAAATTSASSHAPALASPAGPAASSAPSLPIMPEPASAASTGALSAALEAANFSLARSFCLVPGWNEGDLAFPNVGSLPNALRASGLQFLTSGGPDIAGAVQYSFSVEAPESSCPVIVELVADVHLLSLSATVSGAFDTTWSAADFAASSKARNACLSGVMDRVAAALAPFLAKQSAELVVDLVYAVDPAVPLFAQPAEGSVFSFRVAAVPAGLAAESLVLGLCSRVSRFAQSRVRVPVAAGSSIGGAGSFDVQPAELAVQYETEASAALQFLGCAGPSAVVVDAAGKLSFSHLDASDAVKRVVVTWSPANSQLGKRVRAFLDANPAFPLRNELALADAILAQFPEATAAVAGLLPLEHRARACGAAGFSGVSKFDVKWFASSIRAIAGSVEFAKTGDAAWTRKVAQLAQRAGAVAARTTLHK